MNPASSAENKLTLMSIPFTRVDGKGISLNDLVISNFKKSPSPASADQIWLWVDKGDGVWGYEEWFLNNNAKWMRTTSVSTSFDSEYKDGLPSGTAFWYRSYKDNNPRTLTTSGAVDSDVKVEPTIICNEYNFVSFPYPVALKLNDETMADWSNSKKSPSPASADQIMLWVDKGGGVWGYEEWFLNNSRKWMRTTSVSTSFESVHPNGVVVGTGFWYLARSQTGKTSFTITFKSPLEKTAE